MAGLAVALSLPAESEAAVSCLALPTPHIVVLCRAGKLRGAAAFPVGASGLRARVNAVFLFPQRSSMTSRTWWRTRTASFALRHGT